MRTFLIGTVVGTLALGVVLYAAALTLGIVADANGFSTFELALGPVPMFGFERTDAGTATTIGSGLALVALAGGMLNGGAAALLRRRRGARARPDRRPAAAAQR